MHGFNKQYTIGYVTIYSHASMVSYMQYDPSHAFQVPGHEWMHTILTIYIYMRVTITTQKF